MTFQIYQQCQTSLDGFRRREWFGCPAPATTERIIGHVHQTELDDSRLIINKIANELRIFYIINLAWEWFILGGCHIFWHKIKTARADHTTGQYDIAWGRSSCFPLRYPNPGLVLGSSLYAREKEMIHATETPLLTCSREAKFHFICRELDNLRFWDAKVIVFIDYIQKGHAINDE